MQARKYYEDREPNINLKEQILTITYDIKNKIKKLYNAQDSTTLICDGVMNPMFLDIDNYVYVAKQWTVVDGRIIVHDYYGPILDKSKMFVAATSEVLANGKR